PPWRQWFGVGSPNPEIGASGDPAGSGIGASIMNSAQGVGEPAGATIGQGIADGLARAAGTIGTQASSIMESIRGYFAGGVNVPVNLSSQGSKVLSDVQSGAIGAAPGRASGGRVNAGTLYQVG